MEYAQILTTLQEIAQQDVVLAVNAGRELANLSEEERTNIREELACASNHLAHAQRVFIDSKARRDPKRVKVVKSRGNAHEH